ncbi:MAG: SufD family Fe-S cluster assembly protein [Muribaculaceae bacterium]|nr:SufD family Fe-S cluster assembly protein [Muribaculaceae bacterium]
MEKSLSQYIELYRETAEALDAGSAGVLNALRPEAARIIETLRLPRRGEENYETIDLPAILSREYGVNVDRLRLNVNPADSFRCGVPRVATSLAVMVNDELLPPSEKNFVDPGLEICSLAEMARKNPELVGRYYGRIADAANPLVALSTLLAQDGLWIRVRKGARIENPLQIVDILGGADNMLTPVRIVIVMEECSELRMLLCGHTSSGATDQMLLQTMEIFAAPGSHLDIYDLEESAESTTRLSTVWLHQEADSSVLINGMTIYNGVTRNEYHCRYAGEGSELKLYGMGIADASRQIDTYARVDHDSPRCHTDELFKFSVDDRASCAFTGMVRVDYGACKTEAYQSNRNIIGSDEARMYSKPQLEIYNDDVKCSHGSATGQLDEMQLFYMRTRGLSAEEARMLLKQAFMADVIDCVRIPGLKERLAHIVERRFAGEGAGCHDCAMECPTV